MAFDLSKRLKRVRENLELTQLKVSKLTGVTNTTLSNYENGTSRPDPETLKLLAETYNVSTDYLLGLTDTPNQRFANDLSTNHQHKTLDLSTTKSGQGLSENKKDNEFEQVDGFDGFDGADDFLVAFHGQTKELTDEQKDDVLKYVEFLKSRNKEKK